MKRRARLSASERHAQAFRALAHLTRLQVFFFLVRRGDEAAAGEIAAALAVPAPTLSHHLDVLRRNRLLESRRQERNVFYRVEKATVSDLVRLLTACC